MRTVLRILDSKCLDPLLLSVCRQNMIAIVWMIESLIVASMAAGIGRVSRDLGKMSKVVGGSNGELGDQRLII
ncbi:hypothetical protein EYC84_009819 [Monilinia fructicola]|uniref:Uncharacterized protein n=1 Tax=Monilinia fructicola TaxID=38448 RepID=A0A5M9JDN2_MONFR|nr:hypothetical protein EYC84_009819 [Monilinia fructicola]